MMTLEIRMKPHDDVKDKIRFDLDKIWNDYRKSLKIYNNYIIS